MIEDGRMVAEMPMEAFRNEIKRVRVVNPPPIHGHMPFNLLGRQGSESATRGETWIVQGWKDDMADFLTGRGARVREVVHLDLEEGFVELLKASRPETPGGTSADGHRSRSGDRPRLRLEA